MNATKELNSEHSSGVIVCPNCQNELKNQIKETNFYTYYKCAHCEKVYRLKKQLEKDEALFLIGENLSKIKGILAFIFIFLILWFVIYVLLLQRLLYFGY